MSLSVYATGLRRPTPTTSRENAGAAARVDRALAGMPTPDPAGLAAVDPNNPQTWNRYAYVGGTPLEATDPEGLYTDDCYDNHYQGFCGWGPWNYPWYFLGGIWGGGGGGGQVGAGGVGGGPPQAAPNAPAGGVAPEGEEFVGPGGAGQGSGSTVRSFFSGLGWLALAVARGRLYPGADGAIQAGAQRTKGYPQETPEPDPRYVPGEPPEINPFPPGIPGVTPGAAPEINIAEMTGWQKVTYILAKIGEAIGKITGTANDIIITVSPCQLNPTICGQSPFPGEGGGSAFGPGGW